MTPRNRHLSPYLLVAGILLATAGVFPTASANASSPVVVMSLTGQVNGGAFGAAVSTAGDFNGNGYDDMVVGATNADRAYVYYGGPGADAFPDLSLTGIAGEAFGSSVSTAGDLNGDGYADVIVGAPYSNGTGRAYVFYGGPGAHINPDLTFTTAGAGNYFGGSVSTAGDVNGDGYGDVIIGAFTTPVAGPEQGRAYVYYGGSSPDVAADLVFTGAAEYDYFGQSVSTAGDVNKDGFSDLIVGAYGNDAGGMTAGRAYIFFGGPGADAIADVVLTGAAANDTFGGAVSTAGDVNGDGFADVVVGASGKNSGTGAAYVFYGGSPPNNVADITLNGAAASDAYGYSVSTAGDVNGDGYADFVVGAFLNDAGGFDAGRAYVYRGGLSADNIADYTLTGTTNDYFGYSVSSAGDVNGDGYAEVIAGAHALGAGRADVYTFGPFALLSPNGGEQWVVGREQHVRWSGDDLVDLWISFDGGANYSLLLSGVGGAFQNEQAIIAPAPATTSARIRISLTGQPITQANSRVSQGVFQIVEPARPPAAADRLLLTPSGAASNDQLGVSVSSAGDVNGDGYADGIVGAPFAPYTAGPGTGRVYVYYGGPTADNVADLILSGVSADDNFGSSVSGAGDVNGDGYDDVIVGAYHAGGGGRAYVYYGGSAPDNVADLTFLAEAADDVFGLSVSGVGDVNGDGYDDVIVGAPFNDAAGFNAGRAYVYFGGPAPNAVADLVLTGAASLDQLGYSVSAAGDVNGDGCGDVVVGGSVQRSGWHASRSSLRLLRGNGAQRNRRPRSDWSGGR